MNTLPKDPVMLLSFVNTQLRDHYPSLEEFAAIYQIDAAEVISALKNIDYEYDPATNQFIRSVSPASSGTLIHSLVT